MKFKNIIVLGIPLIVSFILTSAVLSAFQDQTAQAASQREINQANRLASQSGQPASYFRIKEISKNNLYHNWWQYIAGGADKLQAITTGDYHQGGHADLFISSSPGLRDAPVWSVTGFQADSFIGGEESIGTTGDVNNDGLPGIIISEYQMDLAGALHEEQVGVHSGETITPIAGLTATNDSPTALGETTQLSASVTSGTNPTFNWKFGDGTSGSGAAVSHVYPHMGLFEARVTASNPQNSLTESTLVSIYEVFSLPPGSSATTSDGFLHLISNPTCTGTFTITGRIKNNPTFGLGDLMLAGAVFQLEAVFANGDPVTSFSKPMTLTINYDESKLPPGLKEVGLQVFRYDTGIADWVRLPVINRDLAGDRITVALDHFSEFIIAAPRGIKHPIFIPLLVR